MKKGIFDKFVRIFVVLLCLVFAGRELPELCSLADDVSNDGGEVGVMSPQAHGASILPQVHKAIVPHYFDMLFAFRGITSQNSPKLVHLQAGIDLLHVLSVQRE